MASNLFFFLFTHNTGMDKPAETPRKFQLFRANFNTAFCLHDVTKRFGSTRKFERIFVFEQITEIEAVKTLS